MRLQYQVDRLPLKKPWKVPPLVIHTNADSHATDLRIDHMRVGRAAEEPSFVAGGILFARATGFSPVRRRKH